MHGLGDTEEEWANIINKQVLPLLKSVPGTCKVVVPRAPLAPVTCNNGKRMTRWFDMQKLPVDAGHPSSGMGCSMRDAEASCSRIHRILDGLCMQGIPAEKIAVGGFSQGGALAMLSALQYPRRLAGCITMSGMLLGGEQLHRLIHPNNRCLGVLWCHGEHDLKVLPSVQRVGCAALWQAGVPVLMRRYPVGHKPHPPAMAEAASFLAERFTALPELVPSIPRRQGEETLAFPGDIEGQHILICRVRL